MPYNVDPTAPIHEQGSGGREGSNEGREIIESGYEEYPPRDEASFRESFRQTRREAERVRNTVQAWYRLISAVSLVLSVLVIVALLLLSILMASRFNALEENFRYTLEALRTETRSEIQEINESVDARMNRFDGVIVGIENELREIRKAKLDLIRGAAP